MSVGKGGDMADEPEMCCGQKAGVVTLKVEAECNQTPPRLPFPKSPENLPKPNSLAGGFLKNRSPNRP